jgi:hypothetical protein
MLSDAPAKPIILVFARTQAVASAIHACESTYDIRWSVDFAAAAQHDYYAVIEQVSDLHPALIVVELDKSEAWLSRLHSDPATRRIPIIGVTNDESGVEWAALNHIDLIYSAETFTAALPELFAQTIFLSDSESLAYQCGEVLSELVVQGLHQFNEQEYFEAHETLETAWKEEPGPIRDLYRAILQVGVAYLQIQRGNYRGAHKMFLRMRQWFAPLPDQCMGINIAQLRADSLAVFAALESLGPDRISEFDLSLLKPIVYTH